MRKNENYLDFYEDLIKEVMKPSRILKKIYHSSDSNYDYLEELFG